MSFQVQNKGSRERTRDQLKCEGCLSRATSRDIHHVDSVLSDYDVIYQASNFEVFHVVMKHCVECLILLLKQNDFRKGN